MTPKEKAIALFKFYLINLPLNDEPIWAEIMHAKKSAIFCVSEIMLYHPISTEPSEQEAGFQKYWEEVKKEIEAIQ